MGFACKSRGKIAGPIWHCVLPASVQDSKERTEVSAPHDVCPTDASVQTKDVYGSTTGIFHQLLVFSILSLNSVHSRASYYPYSFSNGHTSPICGDWCCPSIKAWLPLFYGQDGLCLGCPGLEPWAKNPFKAGSCN